MSMEKFLFKAYDQLQEGIVVLNEDFRVEFVNQRFCEDLFYTPEKLMGSDFEKVIGPEKWSLFGGIPEKEARGGEVESVDLFGEGGQRVSAKLKWFSQSLSGEEYLIVTVVASGKASQAQAALQLENEWFTSILANLEEVVFLLDPLGIVQWVNKSFMKMTPKRMESQVFGSLFSGVEARQALDEAFSLVKSHLREQILEIAVPTKGLSLFFQVQVLPKVDGSFLRGFLVFVRDGTHEVELKRKLIEKGNFIEKVADFSLNGIYIYDLEILENTYVNEGYTHILGYDSKDLNRLSPAEFSELYHPEDREHVFLHMEKLCNAKQGEFFQIRYRFKSKEGQWIWCESRDTPFTFDDAGKVTSYLGYFLNISEQVEAEIDLIRHNHEVEKFVQIASHDLKSPLSSLESCLDLLAFETDPAMVKKIAEMSVQSIQRLRNLVQNLLDHSMTGKELLFGNFDLAKIVESVLFDLQLKIVEKKAQINVQNLPRVYCAEIPIYQLFLNLIGNSLKYNRPEAPVEIVVSCKEHLNHYLFKVQDNGRGIEEENLEKFFEFFKRSKNVKEEGYGIGLANCKRIVESHRGNIWLESSYGQGTTVFFTISKDPIRVS